MKRRLLIIMLLLVGGAIVNVGVAWGCALWSAQTFEHDVPPEWQVTRWNNYWRGNSAVQRAAMQPHRKLGVHHVRFHGRGVECRAFFCDVMEIDYWPFVGGGAFELAAGLPFLCLRGTVLCDLTRADEWSREWAIGVVEPDSSIYQPVRDLPLLPIWPGFAINTVFHAGIVWLLFAGPFVLRRLRGGRRIRRGLCPKCAYDLRGTPSGVACPECGSIVAS